MTNAVENEQNKKIAKSVINANIFNGTIMFFSVFSQLAMIKIILETQSEYALATYIIFAFIIILGTLNFKIQNEKYFSLLNTTAAILFCINLYIFLFKIIGF